MIANTTADSREQVAENREYFSSLYSHQHPSDVRLFDQIQSRGLAKFLSKLSRGKRLLDIGCGTGVFVAAASHYFRTYGFDISIEALKVVSPASTQRWIGIAEAIPLRAESVDIVTCLDVLEHLADPESCVREALRVLRDDGLLFVRTPNPKSIGVALKQSKWFGFRDPTHTSVMSLPEWKRLLRQAGFSVADAGTDFLWDPPYLMKSDNYLEKLVFQGSSVLMRFAKPYYPWSKGENLYILANKSAGLRHRAGDAREMG